MEIVFKGIGRRQWVETISQWRDIPYNDSSQRVHVTICEIDDIEQLQPIHFVLLACLRQRLSDMGYKECYLVSENRALIFNLVQLCV